MKIRPGLIRRILAGALGAPALVALTTLPLKFSCLMPIVLAWLWFAPNGLGQTFTNLTGTGLPQLSSSSVAWGDYDNDGRLDLLLLGNNGSSNICQVWHNNGNGTFSQNTTLAGSPGPANGAVAWGDYDNDGSLDFILIGTIGGSRAAQVWHNNGNGTFTQNTNAGIAGVAFGAVAWGDYDNDGKLDIAVCGHNGSQYVCQLWHNNGNATFTQNISTAFPPLRDGSIAWGDYDSDGYLDLLCAGQSNGVPVCQIWRNLGNGSFSNINAGLTGVWRAAVAWGDYDNDGKPDVLLAGGTTNNPGTGGPTNPVCQVWHNLGNGVFTNLNVGLPGVQSASVAWGDYDNDGNLDILVCGNTNDATGAGVSQLWRNTGSTFTNLTINLAGVNAGSVAWGDFDNDSKLDFVLTGYNTTSGALCQMWHNLSPEPNSLPVPPASLFVSSLTANSVLLNWGVPGFDDATPEPGLNYNVRVGTTPGGSDIVSPQADPSTGFRRLPAMGNARQKSFLVLTNLTLATIYYWSAQAVDTAFAGSFFQSESSFTTPSLAPTVVSATTLNPGPTNITFQAVVTPNGAATGVRFVYGFDTNYGSSTAITSIGAGRTNVTVTNLMSYLFIGFTYHFAVVATNRTGAVTSQDYTFTLPGTPIASVTSTADSGPGSLRQAIIEASAGGTINISASGVIMLTNPLPVIFKSLNINGPGAGNLTIDGNNLYRLFFVDAAAGSVNINNLTLAHGRAKGGDGGFGASGAGGGGLGAGGALFANSGSVTLSNLIFSTNAAMGGNGGSWTNNNSISAGGGGGLGGNGGSALFGAAGGGGFFGDGGTPGNSQTGGKGPGGGGGFVGKGGKGANSSGGGGGALSDGQDATSGGGGMGGANGGGNGASGNGLAGPANGGSGQAFGGGGGGGEGYPGSGYPYFGGLGGSGGKFGGGGGGYSDVDGGAGGDFGGGGGSMGRLSYLGNGGSGGFGGGGAGAYGNVPGAGGFGAGGGGGLNSWAGGGPFGGNGGQGTDGAGGGGGGALGAALFVRANNGASISIINCSIDAGSLTPGAAGASSPFSARLPTAGQSAGSSVLSLGGTNILTTTAGTNTIAGTIAQWDNTPAHLAKNGNGTLVLSATNSYSGSTFLNAGTLIVSGNNSSSSNLYVASGATLSGNGTVGPVTLNSGGTIAPGGGTLTAGNSTWSGAGNYNWQLYDATNIAGAGHGTLQVNGALDVSGVSNFDLNLWTLSSLSPPTNGHPLNFPSLTSASFTLVHTTGGIIGFNAANFVIYAAAHNGAGGFSSSLPQVTFSLVSSGNDLLLALAAQPVLSLQAPTVSNSQATLRALVNPYHAASSVYFMWGQDSTYGATNLVSIGSGSSPLLATTVATNLQAGTLYHYQIVASNAFGTVTTGDQSATTLDIPRSISSFQFVPGQFSLQFTGGPAINYTVLFATNLALPLTNWTVLGPATLSNGIFQFTDIQTTNASRFYILSHQ